MTALRSTSRPIRRETAVTYRGRPLVAELHPGYVTVRQKGCRAAVSVDWATVYETGWKMLAREQREGR